MRTDSKELKARFATEYRKQIDRWEKDNPAPSRPTAQKVGEELSAGRLTYDKFQLETALAAKTAYDEVPFLEVISTPSLEKHRIASADRTAKKQRFEEQLQEAHDAYLDRVLFDHESGFILLRDFRKWRPSKAPQTENPKLSGA